MRTLRRALIGLCLLLSACGGNNGGAGDSGVNDGGASDGGVNDGGASDGGVNDGGTDGGGESDSGVGDGGVNDAGVSDGGASDSGVSDGGSNPDAGAGPTLTLSPSNLSIRQFQGQRKHLFMRATTQGSIPIPVQIVIIDSKGVLSPGMRIQHSGEEYAAWLDTQPSLGVGQHQGTIEFRLCDDESCQRQYTQASLSYDITVLDEDETHQPPLAPWPGVGDWTTFKGDEAHRGHVPVQLDPTRFSQRWLWQNPSHGSATNGTRVSAPVSVSADGAAYLTSSRSDGTRAVLYALSESDGSQLWSSDLGATHVTAPAVAAGQVYAVTTAADDSEAHLWAIQARTGSTSFRTLVPLTQARPIGAAQPVIVGQKAYLSFGKVGGWYGETKALDASSGAVLWSVLSSGDYGVAPAVEGQRLYLFQPVGSQYPPEPGYGAGFTALDTTTGSTAFTVVKPPAPPTEPNLFFNGSSPVLPGNGRALVNRSEIRTSYSSIDCVDLEKQTLAWEVTGAFLGTPVVVGDVFFIVDPDASRLEARSQADGHLLWSWSPPPGLDESFWFTGVVATNNLVFVSTTEQVYAIDIENRSIVWTYPLGGSLSLSASGLLYIVRLVSNPGGGGSFDGKVAAINLH